MQQFPYLYKRMIIGRVTGTPGNLDFDAHAFHLRRVGTQVDLRHVETWDCTKDSPKWKGELDSTLTFEEIQRKGQSNKQIKLFSYI